MARAMPSSTGLTASRCEGFAATDTLILSPEPATNSPSAPRWYFTSPEPWTVRGSMLPSNSRKIWLYFLPTMLASMLSRPRWAMPMHDLVEAGLGGGLADLVDQRDGGLAALEAEALLADELGLQEGLERLGLVELEQDAQLLLAGRLHVRLLDALLDPAALVGIHDVHVLDAGGAAVGVAQDAEDVAQLHEAAALAAEGAGRELAVEVPQGQAVRLDLEVGVAALAVLQRVGVGHQVAAHAVGVDQLEDPRLLDDVVVVGGDDVARPSGSARRGSAASGRSRRRSRPRRAAGACTRLRNSPDCAPWMTRWS